MDSDWALIKRCRQHETAAWQQLIKRYERLVMAIPLRYGLTYVDAEDVAQLTFVNLLDSLRTFHPESNIKSWLITVARRNSWRVLERYDREQVHTAEDLGDSSLLLTIPSNDAPTTLFMVEALHDGLQAIDERCRELLLLLYFDPEKPSYDDVAQRLDMPKNSVGPIRARCLKRLRREVEAHTATADS